MVKEVVVINERRKELSNKSNPISINKSRDKGNKLSNYSHRMKKSASDVPCNNLKEVTIDLKYRLTKEPRKETRSPSTQRSRIGHKRRNLLKRAMVKIRLSKRDRKSMHTKIKAS